MSDKYTLIERLVLALDSDDDDCAPSTVPHHRDRHVNRINTMLPNDIHTTSEPAPSAQHDSTSSKFDTFTSPRYDAFSEVGAVNKWFVGSRNLKLTHRGGCRSGLGANPLFPGASTRMSEMAKAIVALRHRFRSQMGDELTGAIVALFAKFLPTGNAVEVALRKKNSTYILNDIIIQSILEDNNHMPCSIFERYGYTVMYVLQLN